MTLLTPEEARRDLARSPTLRRAVYGSGYDPDLVRGLSDVRLRETLQCMSQRFRNGIGIGIAAMHGGMAPPKQVDGSTLQLWIRGDLGYVRNGTDLKSIADQSGFGRDYQQLTAAKQPLHQGALINGRQAIGDFDGTDDGLVQFAGAAFPGSTYTYFFVFDADTTAATQNLIDYLVGATDRIICLHSSSGAPGDTTNYFAASDFYLNAGIAVAGKQYLTFEITGGGLSALRRNGSELVTGTPVAITPSNTSGIGTRHDGGSAFFNGRIGEVLAYSPRPSAAARDVVEAYIQSYWGL